MKTISLVLFVLVSSAYSFVIVKPSCTGRRPPCSVTLQAAPTFEIEVALPPTNSGLVAQMKIEPVLSGDSEIVEVRYKLPFGLDVAPKNNLAVCTKDGLGGEKVGDVLRYTSQWKMGLPPGNGLVSTAASFAGGLSWQCSMFDVARATKWEAVLEALTSNVPSRTDEVVLIFERPLGGQ
jgi:hypothetical protein